MMDDFFNWLVFMIMTKPICECIISFSLGTILGVFIMAILNAADDFQDPYTNYYEGGEDDGI